jgi:hypothetical protein
MSSMISTALILPAHAMAAIKWAASCIDEFRRLRQEHRDSVSIRERRSQVDVRRREFPASLVNGGEQVIVEFEQPNVTREKRPASARPPTTLA